MQRGMHLFTHCPVYTGIYGIVVESKTEKKNLHQEKIIPKFIVENIWFF